MAKKNKNEKASMTLRVSEKTFQDMKNLSKETGLTISLLGERMMVYCMTKGIKIKDLF